MDTLGGKEWESVMIGGRGVVGLSMGNTKMDQNGHSSICNQRCNRFVLGGSYNLNIMRVDTWKEVGFRISHYRGKRGGGVAYGVHQNGPKRSP